MDITEIPTLDHPEDIDNYPDSRKFFEPPSRLRLKKMFLYLLGFSNTPLLCYGAEGVGKSTMLTSLEEDAPSNWRLFRMGAPFTLEGESLLKELASQFGVSVRGGDHFTEEEFVGRMARLIKSGDLPVLVVDDAEHLTVTQLALLKALAGSGENSAIRLLLMTADASQLGEGQCRQFEMLPFDQQEGAAFAKWRSSQARQASPSPSPVKPIEQPEAPAESIDRIPEVVIDTPVEPTVETTVEIKTEVRETAKPSSGGSWLKRILLVIIGLGLAGMLLFQEQINQLFVAQTQFEDATEQALPIPELQPSNEVAESLTALPEPQLAHVDLSDEAPQQIDEVADSQVAEEDPPAVEEGSQVVDEVEEAEVTPAPVSAADVVAEAEAKPEQVEVAEPVVEQKSEEVFPIKTAEWILAQDPNYFTLHLMSVRNEENLREYITKRKLTQEASYYKAVRKSGDWYVLLYGAYPDAASAYAAHAKLAGKLGVKDAFVRVYKDIQQDAARSLE